MTYIDLTHPLITGMPVYPGDPEFALHPFCNHVDHGLSSHSISGSLHTGTHMDAPFHMNEGARKLDEFSITDFIRKAVCLDMKESISSQSLMIPEGVTACVLRFDWSAQFGTEQYYTDYPTAPLIFFKQLIEQGIRMVAMDTPSPDYTPYKTHHLLFEHDVLIVENIADPGALPVNQVFELNAIPLRINQDGSYCRIFARMDAGLN